MKRSIAPALKAYAFLAERPTIDLGKLRTHLMMRPRL